MTFFPRKADLLEQVRTSGERYLHSVRTENPHELGLVSEMHTFNTLVLDESAKKRGDFIVKSMIEVPKDYTHEGLMETPVFHWNGSLEDPVVHRGNNSLINSSDCFPPSLSVLAMDYADKGYGNGSTVYDLFVQKVGALFFNNATPQDFQNDAASNGISLHFPDPSTSPSSETVHIASGKLLYKTMQEGGLPAFDIHDITHHASQMAQYGEFYRWLVEQATDEVMGDPNRRLAKRAIRSVLLTTLEHSIVSGDDGPQSFGCLNWQAPHKSVLSTGVSKRAEYRINDYPIGAQDINLWSSIRAIGSIYREQLEAQKLTNSPVNWMEELGYSMDQELLERIKPGQTYTYADLTFDAARRATLIVPKSPEELFSNATAVIESVLDA